MKDLRNYIKHNPYQENIMCCSASAALLCFEIHLSMARRYVHLSRLFTYYQSRMMQGRLNQNGVDLRTAFESLIHYGTPPTHAWPFIRQRVDKEPSITALQSALEHRINEYVCVDPSNFKKMIDDGVPVAIGLHTGRKFWKIKGPLEEQEYYPINITTNRGSNPHAATIIGYDDDLHDGSWIIANSLGPSWGDNGIGILPYSCYIDIGEAYSITSF